MAAQRRLVITGPECTGKSQLAIQLGEALRVPVVPEFSRTYAEQVGRPLTADDVEPIARGQMAAEDATRATSALLVLDTDLVSTCVYAAHYYGAVPSWIEEEARRRLGDLYLLASPDIPWIADGIRDQPQQREQIWEAFRSRLTSFGATVLPIAGLGPVRMQHALAAVRGWRAAHHGDEVGTDSGVDDASSSRVMR